MITNEGALDNVNNQIKIVYSLSVLYRHRVVHDFQGQLICFVQVSYSPCKTEAVQFFQRKENNALDLYINEKYIGITLISID